MLRENQEVIKCNLDKTPIKEYPSIKIAAIKNNISACSISNACRKNQKTAGGFIWKYKSTPKPKYTKQPKMPLVFLENDDYILMLSNFKY